MTGLEVILPYIGAASAVNTVYGAVTGTPGGLVGELFGPDTPSPAQGAAPAGSATGATPAGTTRTAGSGPAGSGPGHWQTTIDGESTNSVWVADPTPAPTAASAPTPVAAPIAPPVVAPAPVAPPVAAPTPAPTLAAASAPAAATTMGGESAPAKLTVEQLTQSLTMQAQGHKLPQNVLDQLAEYDASQPKPAATKSTSTTTARPKLTVEQLTQSLTMQAQGQTLPQDVLDQLSAYDAAQSKAALPSVSAPPVLTSTLSPTLAAMTVDTPPQVEAPKAMPSAATVLAAAKRTSLAEQRRRQGRASTILTQTDDRLGA